MGKPFETKEYFFKELKYIYTWNMLELYVSLWFSLCVQYVHEESITYHKKFLLVDNWRTTKLFFFQ